MELFNGWALNYCNFLARSWPYYRDVKWLSCDSVGSRKSPSTSLSNYSLYLIGLIISRFNFVFTLQMFVSPLKGIALTLEIDTLSETTSEKLAITTARCKFMVMNSACTLAAKFRKINCMNCKIQYTIQHCIGAAFLNPNKSPQHFSGAANQDSFDCFHLVLKHSLSLRFVSA